MPAATKTKKKSGGGRKVSADRAARKPRAKKSPRIKTVAENTGHAKGSLADRLDKAFALTNCKRLVAIGEERNRALSRLSELAESKKAVVAELAETPAGPEWNRLACQKVRIEEEQDKLKQIRLTSVTDVFRLVMECAGGTLFEAAEESAGSGGAAKTGGEEGLYAGRVRTGEITDGETGEVTRVTVTAGE
jgi:hypothetical protein